MDRYFAYTRVSTVKQGERGTSLDEQRSAIEAYALRNGLTISEWFLEMETAAKQGRRQFSRMLAELRKARAKGVIIHKIDRSARNLKDWAQLGDLIDAGVDIRFAHESLDLTSRGGRLAADIQAVVAADFIRNHRQVVRMGFEGRLKQGVYPLPAPRGYLDRGAGKPKVIDPVAGPLVRQAFELYATAAYSFDTLRIEMARRGLRGRTGKPLSLDAVSTMLRNPFYIGIIHIKRTGQTFEGAHAPLVSKPVFDSAQAVADGRLFSRPQRHARPYRRLIRCGACGHSLVAEVQKGHAYYRCHTRTCHGTTLRERDIDSAFKARLASLALTDEELGDFRDLVSEIRVRETQMRDDLAATRQRDLANCEDRLTRLTDAYLDGVIDGETFQQRKDGLLMERAALRVQPAEDPENDPSASSALKKLELLNTAYQQFDLALAEEKREIVSQLSSNLIAEGKNLVITTHPAFSPFLDWRNSH